MLCETWTSADTTLVCIYANLLMAYIRAGQTIYTIINCRFTTNRLRGDEIHWLSSMKYYKSSRKFRAGLNWYTDVNWSTTTMCNGIDRVSVPSPIAIDILMDTMARDRAHMYLFYNETGMNIFEPVFYECKQTFDVTNLSTKEVPGLQKQFSITIYVLQTRYSYTDITRTFKSNCNDFSWFEIYTENSVPRHCVHQYVNSNWGQDRNSVAY